MKAWFTAPPRRLLLLLLLNAMLLLALGAVIWFDNAANRGITYTPDPTEKPIAWADEVQVGVNIFNLHLEPDPAVVTRTLRLARELGVTHVRIQMPWEDVEIHGRGDFEDRRHEEQIGVVSAWAKYDRIIAEANRQGLAVVLRIDRAPLWASTTFKSTPAWQEGITLDPTSTGPPDDFNDYYRFVGTVAERYRGQVRFFQIWNEPNLANEWNWQTPHPEGFAWFLCAAHDSIKEANPDAVIVFPPLAPVDGLDEKRAPMTELEFLDRVYQEVEGGCFDIMSAQAYGLGQSPDEHRYVRVRPFDNWSWARPLDTRTDVSRVVLLREVMEQHGDGDKAVWLSEFGWNSAPPHIPAERRYTWGEPVSEQQKADYIIGHIERAKQEWPWVGVMHVWMLRYGGYIEPDVADPTPYFALVDRDWNRLPAYTALQAYLAQPVAAGVGVHAWEHAAVESIPGGWRLRFIGSRVGLVGSAALPDALTHATLDGQPVSLASETLATGETLLTAHAPARAAPPDEPGAPHTLEVFAPAAAAPQRFVVARDPPLPWLWVAAPLLLVGLLLLSGAATMQTLFTVADGVVARSSLGRLGLRAWLRTASGERVVLLGMLLALLIFYRATPQLPLTLLGAALFGGLALLRPALALLFVPATVLLFFIPKGIWDERLSITADADGFLIPLHEVVLLTVVGATALHAALDGVRWLLHRQADSVAGGVAVLRSFVVRHAGLLGAVALFLLVGTLGVVVAGGEGRRAALREWRWLIVEPLLFYGLLWYHTWRIRHTARHSGVADAPPAVGASLVATPGALRGALLTALVTGGALVGVIGVLQFLGLNLVPLLGYKVSFSDDRLFVEGVRRVSSVYGHPNNLGLTMGRIWPIAAVLALAAVLPPAQPVQWKRALFFGIGALLCIGGLLVSFSKGALLGAFGAVLVLAVLVPHSMRGALAGSRRQRVVLAAVGGVLVLVAAAAILFAGERLNPLGETSSIRLKTWASALAMAGDHPLFGVGLDQFGQHYQAYMHPSLAATNERFTSHPHNLLLDIWLRMGVVGVAVFAWLVVRCYRQVLPGRAERQQAGFPATPGDYVRLGVVAAMTAALLHGMVDNFYFVPDLAYIFWLLLWVGEGWCSVTDNFSMQ